VFHRRQREQAGWKHGRGRKKIIVLSTLAFGIRITRRNAGSAVEQPTSFGAQLNAEAKART
jgi:hypothetical protein